MLTFKFKYSVKPITEYNFRYGLKSKTRPYPFNYPAGTDNGGMYRLNYDRRDQIHIEMGETSYVLLPEDIDINKEIAYVLWARDMDINKESILEKPIDVEIIKEHTNNRFERTKKEVLKSSSVDFEKNIIKNIEIEKEIIAEKTIEKILEIYKSFLLEKTVLKGLIIEKIENILEKSLKKELNIEKPLKNLDKPLDHLLINNNRIVLGKVKKSIGKGIERSFSKNNSFGLEEDIFSAKMEDTFVELYYEKVKELLELDLFKKLDIFRGLKFTSDFLKDLDIEKTEYILTKEEKSEILIKSVILLYKIKNEINIHEEEGPYFKKLNEIFKEKEPIFNILVGFFIYDLFKEKDFMQIETTEEEMTKFKDEILDKNFEVNLEIEDIFKMLINNTKHNLFEDIEEDLLKNETIHEVDIEKCFKQLEEVYEIIVDIEKRMKRLDKEYIVDLYEEKDIYQLIKKLTIHDLITEEEFVQLKKSPIGKILLERAIELNKNVEIREIEIDESIPMVKAYKEIMINEDINTAKEAIEIDINKEKEFWKVLNKIEIEDDKEKIEFNKRFWFLRATDPFDWKILPYSDYPYKEKPIIFEKELIPDNWQLDMPWVSKLHEGVHEHPIPFGDDLGTEEMAISIEIMIDVINIMILIWSRMYYNFSGYTGSQAVIRFTKLLYDWLILETSIEEMEKKGSKEHYFRCYRWIRWESEKVAIKARDDMKLNGNMYISEWIFELIYYMENHHFDTMPIFDVIEKMDEFRAMLPTDDPQGDIDFVLNKIKGMRHKIIECKANKNNE